MHAMKPLLASLVFCSITASGVAMAQTTPTPPPAATPAATPPATPLHQRVRPLPATQNSNELQRQQQNSRDQAQSMANQSMQDNRRQSDEQSKKDAAASDDATHYPASGSSTH